MKLIFKILKSFMYGSIAAFFKIRGNDIGTGSRVSHKATLRKTKIGNYSYIAEYSELNCVDMGNYCSIGPAVHIGSMEHPYWKPSTSARIYREDCKSEIRTQIGHDVWIGALCCIRQGVKIGNGAVIGAHSFVNKDVPPYSIVFGIPAKVHKMRFSYEIIDAIQRTNYFDFPPQKAKELLDPIAKMLNSTS